MSTPGAQDTEITDGNLLYAAGLLTGGLVLGSGIMMLPWSFGWATTKDPVTGDVMPAAGDCLNCDLGGTGFSALDNLGTLGLADYSIGMIVLGFLVLVVINASAWQRTGGY